MLPTPKRSRAEDNTKENAMLTPSEIAALELPEARMLIKILQQNLKKAEERAEVAWGRANTEKKEALARADATVKRVAEEKKEALVRADMEKKEALARADMEKKEALAKVDMEKKEALARADMEKKEALAKVDMEKKEALARADMEKKEALAKVDMEKKEALARADMEKKEALERADAGRKEAVDAWKSHAQQLHLDTQILMRNQGKMLDIIGTGVRYFDRLEEHVPTLQQTSALLKEHAEELDETGFMVVEETMSGPSRKIKTHIIKGKKSNLEDMISSFGPDVMRRAEPFRVTKNPDEEIKAVIEVGNAMIKREKAKRSAGDKPRYVNITLIAYSFEWTDRENGLISLEQFYELLAMLTKPQKKTIGDMEDILSEVCAGVEDISLDIVNKKTEFKGAAVGANGVEIPERPFPGSNETR